MVDLSYPLEDMIGCAVCGSTHTIPIQAPERYGTMAQMVICGTCGLGFLNPRWSEASYTSFYEHDYRLLVSQSYNLSRLATRQRVHASRVLLTCSPFIPRGGSVLDIGCSTGTLLNAFQHYWDCQVFGIEPSVDEASFAEREYGITVFNGLFEAFKIDDHIGQYDLLIISQTLNHLLSPYLVLERARRLLRPKGKLFIEVQNFPEFAQLRKLPVKVDHTYYFSSESLMYMLAKIGFDPLHLIIDTQSSFKATDRYLTSIVPSIHIHALMEIADPHDEPAPGGVKIAHELQSIMDIHSSRPFSSVIRSTARRLVGDKIYTSVKRLI